MDPSDTTRPCPDCTGTLHRIRFVAGKRERLDLKYAPPETRPDFPGIVRIHGNAFGMMCSECSRIFLYGDSGIPEAPPPDAESTEW